MFLSIASPPVLAGPPTYHREVSRLLQKHCQECHRPGQVAPFSLLTYDQARKRADDLAEVARERKMPPWPASTKEGGPFRDVRSLSEAEIATLDRLGQGRRPRGRPEGRPASPRVPSGWPLGQPDLILSLHEPYALDADGADEHRVFVIPTGLTEGKWIAAIDFRPGNPKVVHHALGAFDMKKRAGFSTRPTRSRATRSSAGSASPLTASCRAGPPAGGRRPCRLGSAATCPPGPTFLLQVHYHKSGKPETDATQVAFYFAKEPIDKEISIRMVTPPMNRVLRFIPDLFIPAGEARHEVTGQPDARR